jgi:hypothetical protein
MSHKRLDPPYTPTFVTVKLIDIGITYTYFFAIGLIMAKIFDYVYIDLLKEQKTNWKTYPIGLFTLNILFHFFLIGVSVYFIRNLVQLIPYPLEGIAGYQHLRLKELGGGAILTFMIFMFQDNLTDKVKIYAQRVIKTYSDKGKEEADDSNEIEESDAKLD